MQSDPPTMPNSSGANTLTAQQQPPIKIPVPGGEVIIATAREKQLAYDTLHYAPSRRAGNVLYVSGAIVHRLPGEANDVQAFKEQVRRTFHSLAATLTAGGAAFADVAMMNSFHVWQSPHFNGDKKTHIDTFALVKDEFLKESYPAWTAVGTTELITDGMVEIQLIAHLPQGSFLMQAEPR